MSRIDERLFGQTEQDLDPGGKCDQVFSEHGFELMRMTEADRCAYGFAYLLVTSARDLIDSHSSCPHEVTVSRLVS